MKTLSFIFAFMCFTTIMGQGIGVQQLDRYLNEEPQVFNDTIWARQGWQVFGSAADVTLYRGASGLLKTDDDFQADRIGIATAPTTLFDIAGTTAGDYLRYNGTEFNLRLTTVLPTPGAVFQVYDGSGTAVSSLIIDELGSGGFTVRNISGQEVVKINGSINEGHSFYNQEYFSVGRNGVTPTYGGTLAGAMVTFNNSRFDRNANTGLNNPDNYQVVIEDEDADSDWLGLGWVSGGTGTYQDNIGAAIVFEPVGAFSQGSLHFYQKTSTSDAVAPVNSMSLIGGEVVLQNLGAAGTSDSVAIVDGDGALQWKTIICDGGRYTPTLTAVANIDAITLTKDAFYSVNNNIVTVHLEFTLDPTASTTTTFRASLPPSAPSDFVATSDATGYVGGIATSTGKQLSGDATIATDDITFSAGTNHTVSVKYEGWFTYEVK